jgi:hypothetical protein
LTVLFIAGWVCFFIYLRKYQAADEKAQSNSKVINTATKLVKQFTDTLTHSKHRTYEAPKPISYLESKKEVLPGWADTAERSLDLGADYKNQVAELTTLTITLKDSLLRANIKLNAANKKVFYYQSEFIRLSYTPDADPEKAGLFGYHYNTGLIVANYNKRNWFLGPRHYFMDVSSADTNMTVEGVKHYQVEQPIALYGFKLFGVTRYSVYSKEPEFGPGVEISRGPASLRASYLYNMSPNNTIANPLFNRNRANLYLSATYDFIKL